MLLIESHRNAVQSRRNRKVQQYHRKVKNGQTAGLGNVQKRGYAIHSSGCPTKILLFQVAVISQDSI